MDGVLHIALLNAAVATVLAVVAAGVSRVFRRAPLTRALWVLVLLKLVTPPVWSVQVWRQAVRMQEPLARIEEPHIVVEATPAAEVDDSSESMISEDLLPTSIPTLSPAPAPAATPLKPQASAPAPHAPFPWVMALGVVWLSGCAAYVIVIVVAAARMRWLIQRSWPVDKAVEHLTWNLSRRMGLRRPPAVAFVHGAISPMLCALVGSPRVLLPKSLWEKLSDEQRETVLAHELAHLRRRDHWATLLELVVSVLYWWHPVVWWARHELREAAEQCCDAWVVWSMPRRASSYAAALIEAVEFISTARPGAPALASRMGQFADLKRRLVMIKQGNVRRALSRPAFAAVCGVAGLLLPLSPSFGGDVAAAPEAPAPAIAPLAVAAPEPAPAAAAAPRAPLAANVAVSDDDKDGKGDADEQREKADQDRDQADQERAKADKQRAEAERKTAEAQKRMAQRYEQEIQRAHRDLQRAQEQLQRAAQRVAELEARRGEMMSRFSQGIGSKGGESSSAATPQANKAMGDSSNRIRSFGMGGGGFGAGGGFARGGGGPDVERRLDIMEKQMQMMMDQLRQMRRQMRSGNQQGQNAPDASSAK